MAATINNDEYGIISRENDLRDWFTHGKDGPMREIDGIDIGWGGSQRWVTSNMADMNEGRHLDFACGYGTFLAEVGWRFPRATLYGLNIDYKGPHASIMKLLERAHVRAALVQADARGMPFAEESFDSVSCFLGLQDIQIGFARDGVGQAVSEAMRVLKPDCCLTLVDEFTFDALLRLLENQKAIVIFKDELSLDIKWNRNIAEKAIEVYSEGWAAQSRAAGVRQLETVRRQAYKKMRSDMERQFRDTGYYVPHGPLRMVVAKKTNSGRKLGKRKE